MPRENESDGRWRLETEESFGGGPFELEVSLTFTVYDNRTNEVVLQFSGTEEGDYGGVGWKHTGSYGVVAAKLEEGGLVVEDAKGEKRRYALPRRQLSVQETTRLIAAHSAYTSAREQYLYEACWSSEVSIPGKAIEASYQAIRPHWEALCTLLGELHLSDVPPHDFVWPEQIPGGERAGKPLRKWIEQDEHRKNGMRRYNVA